MLNHVTLVGEVVNQFEQTIVIDVDNEYIAVNCVEGLEPPKLEKGQTIGVRGKLVEHQQVLVEKLSLIKK